jgi:predicted PurR-regulated permease PerM
MTVDRNLIFWTIIVFVFVSLLWLLSDILLPFAVGAALAYMRVPLADWLERLGMNRTVAALLIVTTVALALIVTTVALALILLTLLLVPLLAGQLLALMASIPGYVTRLQALLANFDSPWLKQTFGDHASKTMPELMTQGAGYLSGFLGSLRSGGKALISFISVIVIMPVVTFYLICDWHRMIDTLNSWVPPHSRDTVDQLVREIDAAVSGFLRGQADICLIVALYFAIALSLAGLNFSVLIGVLTFIPYVGSIIGILIGVGVAIEQFWPQWVPVAIVVGIFLVGQFVAAYVLGPRLVGNKVGLHPVWLIFAMFAFGYLFGFVGLLIAVPLGAAIAVLFRFALKRYFASPFYGGAEAT